MLFALKPEEAVVLSLQQLEEKLCRLYLSSGRLYAHLPTTNAPAHKSCKSIKDCFYTKETIYYASPTVAVLTG